MSEYLRRALEKRLENFVPKGDDDILRRKKIKNYASIFNAEEIAEILNGKKPLYFNWEKGEYIYLPK